ncbi:serine/arginine repetitive matrix protein 1-like isoform X2 [Lathamus discolor]|uniref:serine/arginine repetitive matrix protein 1-like isoform X2 n=1 Tax=Lathamus discolor TaxID=678569 RepID=UPI0032B81583
MPWNGNRGSSASGLGSSPCPQQHRSGRAASESAAERSLQEPMRSCSERAFFTAAPGARPGRTRRGCARCRPGAEAGLGTALAQARGRHGAVGSGRAGRRGRWRRATSPRARPLPRGRGAAPAARSGPLPVARRPPPVAAGRARAMALPGGQCCPWRWAALLAAVTCLLPGALLGAALGAGAAWWALRGRPPARRPLPPRSPARLLPPERSPPLRLPPRGPGPSLAARFPSPGQRAPWPLPTERAGTNGSAATATGPGVSAPSRGNCPGAPPQSVRRRDPLPQDRSPEPVLPPKRMCRMETPEAGAGSYREVPRRTGREQELRRRQESAPRTADKAVQTEEAVERREEERRQPPSPAPSLQKGRPRRRRICLLVPGETHPLALFPELHPGYPIVEEILEREREAAWQRPRWVLGPKAATSQGSSGSRRTRAASTAAASVVSGQAASTGTGLADTTQPGSGSAPVLPGSSTSASSTRSGPRDRARKRHKEEDHRDAKWPFAPPTAKRRRF